VFGSGPTWEGCEEKERVSVKGRRERITEVVGELEGVGWGSTDFCCLVVIVILRSAERRIIAERRMPKIVLWGRGV